MLAQWHAVSLSFPDKTVLDGVSLTVHPGDRIGLVGENGAGKTCLFRILLRQLTPTRGHVYLAQGIRIGYMSQHLVDTEVSAADATCWDVAVSPFSELLELERKLNHYFHALASAKEDQLPVLLERLGDAQERYERLGGYTYRARVESTLNGLGLPSELWHRPVATLSAGQKVRLALARLLLGEHDLLLLDEPTNHLDLAARDWFIDHLSNIDVAYVVASHDRHFLDAVTTRIAYLDRGKLTVYPGNYSAFREQLEKDRAKAWHAYEQNQKLVRKLEAQARQYKTWSDRTEKKKQGAFDKGYVTRRAAKLMKRSLQAQRRLEQAIETMRTEKPFVKDPVTIDFHAASARSLLRVRDLVVGYDAANPLADALTFSLEPGERLAIVGPNGSGKSTLLKTLLGELPPLAGEVWRSRTVNIGYFDQDARSLAPETTALEAVLAVEADETLARTVMGRLRIRRDSVYKTIGSLSAGERAKVLLTRLILGGHNLLILDEPTNHLDIETQDALLDALRTFPGGIIFVSHDRYFMKQLATEVEVLIRTQAVEKGRS